MPIEAAVQLVTMIISIFFSCSSNINMCVQREKSPSSILGTNEWMFYPLRLKLRIELKYHSDTNKQTNDINVTKVNNETDNETDKYFIVK